MLSSATTKEGLAQESALILLFGGVGKRLKVEYGGKGAVGTCQNHECPSLPSLVPLLNLLSMKTALLLQFKVSELKPSQELANKQGLKASPSKHKLPQCFGHKLEKIPENGEQSVRFQ